MLIFVYGSLKQGFANHRVLRSLGAEFVAPARVRGYFLVSLGAFPAACQGAADDEVAGELYDVSERGVARLDDFEGVGSGFYQRVQLLVDAEPSDTRMAHAYVMKTPPAWARPFDGPVWGESAVRS